MKFPFQGIPESLLSLRLDSSNSAGFKDLYVLPCSNYSLKLSNTKKIGTGFILVQLYSKDTNNLSSDRDNIEQLVSQLRLCNPETLFGLVFFIKKKLWLIKWFSAETALDIILFSQGNIKVIYGSLLISKSRRIKGMVTNLAFGSWKMYGPDYHFIESLNLIKSSN